MNMPDFFHLTMSEGEYVHTPGSTNRSTDSAFMPPTPPLFRPRPATSTACAGAAPCVQHPAKAGRKLLCGGGLARRPICPTPPSLSLVAVPGGGFGLGVPYLPCPGVRGGGGPTPTYMAQNDPHVALITLTTHMWGNFFPWKKFSGPKFVFRRLWWQHPSLHKIKGLAQKPISGTPPPLLRRAPMPSPPPPPAKQFSGRPICTCSAIGGALLLKLRNPPLVDRWIQCPPIGLGAKRVGEKPGGGGGGDTGSCTLGTVHR